MANDNFFMPLYWDSHMTDPNVVAMTDSEFRAYMYLLWTAWNQEPVGTLPADDARLAAWARVSLRKWRIMKPKVLRCFRLQDGRYCQKKMMQVYERVLANRKTNHERGKKAAAARWNRTSPASSNAQASSQAPVEDAIQSHSQNHSQSDKLTLSQLSTEELPVLPKPSCDEWMDFCAKAGLPEWRAKTEWLKQEAQGWQRTNNWKGYVGYLVKKWKEDGCPMPPSKPRQAGPS